MRMTTACTAWLLPASIALSCAAPVHAQALKQTSFPDGTGSIGLGNGWTLNGAYRGSPHCQGPDGCHVILGLPWAIVPPDSSLRSLPSVAQSPIASPNDLVGALVEVLTKRSKARVLSVRMRPAPSPTPGAPAAYLLYEYVRDGQTFVGIGYFTPLVYGPGDPWQLYSSAVIAPKDKFTKHIKTMMAMWKSWRPNGKPPLAGSESARIDEAIRDSYDSFAEIQKEFRKLL
jgi:hypothetical protein